MDGTYSVYFGGKEIGSVTVTQEGLYYRFSCCCKLTGEIVCKLTVICDGERLNLGILIPEGNLFCLDTKIPLKRFPKGKPAFEAVPNKVVASGKFVPIKPEEPFAYIARLKEAFLSYQNGQPGVVISSDR